MFLNTNTLNEGGCRDKCSGVRKRELLEGKNPKNTTDPWQATQGTHVNSHWQRLRK